ncbi:MAG TPA: hypothetical protein VMH38_08195 [Thermoplasmata archaeon]|nr:hypothetical protein [Thermoplasmata archaeon]
MNARVLLSIAGLVVIALAFFIIFEYPQFADYAFYLLIFWMVTNFVLLYSLRPRTLPAGGDASADVSPFPSQGAALPSGAAPVSSTPSGGIGFCIYCATPISPGTRACPACGHTLPQW